jgi:uncharacterized protein YukE
MQIDHSSLDKHAEEIKQIVEQVNGAVNQVRQLFDVKAFGIIGTVWATAVNEWVQSHTKAVDAAVQACTETADKVKSMNENYKQNETDVAQSFTAIANGTPSQGA